MRMRVKKWARPELAACPFYVPAAEEYRGRWREAFPKARPLYLELGCGKGVSTCQMALNDEAHNYIAIDLITTVLGVAKRNAENAYRGVRPVDNLVFSNFDIEYSVNFFAPEDRIERIYISFCNPWTKSHSQNKHRLTHPRQLVQYRTFLTDGGEIHFKTDDDALFSDSCRYFEDAGFDITYITDDLHASGYAPNYESEHEKKFAAEGVRIKFLIARKRPDAEWTAPEGEDFRIPVRPNRAETARKKETIPVNP